MLALLLAYPYLNPPQIDPRSLILTESAVISADEISAPTDRRLIRGYNGSYAIFRDSSEGTPVDVYSADKKFRFELSDHIYIRTPVPCPEGFLVQGGLPEEPIRYYFHHANGRTKSVLADGPVMKTGYIRTVPTATALHPCVVLGAESDGYANTYLYDTGKWIHLTQQRQGLLFCPFGVSKSGAVLGGSFKPSGNDFESLADGEPYGMEVPCIYTLRPTYWKEGAFHTIPLPKPLESLAKDNPVGLRLLMEWKGNFLALYQGTPNRQFEDGYWIYQNKTWLDLSKKYGKELPGFIVTDYDLNSGRILLANANEYKIVQL